MTPLRSRVLNLFAANIVSFVVVGLSFLAYSRLLSPGEFGLYVIALSITSISTMVLDGGLKITIIKLERPLSHVEEADIIFWMLSLFAVAATVFAGVATVLARLRPDLGPDLRFVGSFVGCALVLYPFITVPTALLERRLEYTKLGWIEASAMLLERALPALFMIFGRGLYAFVVCLVIGRSVRVLAVTRFQKLHLWAPFPWHRRSMLPLLKEGLWLQAGTLASLLRDNLHTLIVGPWFGKEWIGYYGWAMQLSVISSQAFAAIAARVSLPIFANSNDRQERWTKCLYQVRMLTMLTAPVLWAVWYVLPGVNEHLFHGKWTPALVLLPLVFARMLPGLATTPVSPLLIVERGGRTFAGVSFTWSCCEVVGAILMLSLVGPTGLAWSYALVVWAGLWLMLVQFRSPEFNLGTVSMQLFWRPSLAIPAAAVATLTVCSRVTAVWSPTWRMSIVIAAAIILLAYASESDLRRFFRIRPSQVASSHAAAGGTPV